MSTTPTCIQLPIRNLQVRSPRNFDLPTWGVLKTGHFLRCWIGETCHDASVGYDRPPAAYVTPVSDCMGITWRFTGQRRLAERKPCPAKGMLSVASGPQWLSLVFGHGIYPTFCRCSRPLQCDASLAESSASKST